MGKSCRIALRTYAKLNLCLDVIKKRDDGYHEIDSLFQNVSLYDEMEIEFVHGDGKITIESNFSIENNIIEKIWNRIQCKDKNAIVRLKKNIPMGGGLGGGSSNAAGFIIALEKAGLIDKRDILDLANSVGSDVPFFIYGGTALVTGRGENVTPVEPLKNFRVDLYFPNFSISTKEAYSKLKQEWFNKAPMKAHELYEVYQAKRLDLIKSGTYNIFEKIIPEDVLKEIERLRKEHPAALTGSGSTYFCVNPEGKYTFVEKGVEIYAFEEG